MVFFLSLKITHPAQFFLEIIPFLIPQNESVLEAHLFATAISWLFLHSFHSTTSDLYVYLSACLQIFPFFFNLATKFYLLPWHFSYILWHLYSLNHRFPFCTLSSTINLNGYIIHTHKANNNLMYQSFGVFLLQWPSALHHLDIPLAQPYYTSLVLYIGNIPFDINHTPHLDLYSHLSLHLPLLFWFASEYQANVSSICTGQIWVQKPHLRLELKDFREKLLNLA